MTKKTSIDSLEEANRDRAKFSEHGNALGAAGLREVSDDPADSAHLRRAGDSIAVNPGSKGFGIIEIDAAWDNVALAHAGIVGTLIKKAAHIGVDLDLGCMYELADGTRGAIQAFGEKFGSFDKPPFIRLSGDERTGDAPGNDEVIKVNGAHWDKIKRIVVYLYIYKGAPDWAAVKPRLRIIVPGEDNLYVTPHAHDDTLRVCALGGLENERSGIKLTNYTEYFPGHEEMDRAFGFGLEWGEGRK